MSSIYVPVNSDPHVVPERGGVVLRWYRHDEDEPIGEVHLDREQAMQLAITIIKQAEIVAAWAEAK